MKSKLVGICLAFIGTAIMFSACSVKNSKHSSADGTGDGFSHVTSWPFNDSRTGGFEVAAYKGQRLPIGMEFVQGGRFTMGAVDDELPTVENNSFRRTVTVSSFYMDMYECENVSYREYTEWMYRIYWTDYPELVLASRPDGNVWRSPLAYNEPYAKYYFKMPAYDHYPVVGVNWYQAADFCKWRTDRINEKLLIEAGIMDWNPNQSNEDNFNTMSYVGDQYEGTEGRHQLQSLDPNNPGNRKARFEDGIFLPDFRLPTEAEWEYAALGGMDNNVEPESKRRRGEETNLNRKVLPWWPKVNHRVHRNYYANNEGIYRWGRNDNRWGEFEGNFMRGQGDYMGIAGGLNDGADITAPVNMFLPNEFGLYNMAGNVSEWVMDTYRPSSHQDVADFRPFRGNKFMTHVYDDEFKYEEKDSLGHLLETTVNTNTLLRTRPYDVRSADLSSYRDGDTLSNFSYKYGENTLINDSTKVYKGGSWADRAYWLSPGTRRYMQGNLATCTIGFRCIMDRLGGSPGGGDFKQAGNEFPYQKWHRR